jgi:hypothetical protein
MADGTIGDTQDPRSPSGVKFWLHLHSQPRGYPDRSLNFIRSISETYCECYVQNLQHGARSCEYLAQILYSYIQGEYRSQTLLQEKKIMKRVTVKIIERRRFGGTYCLHQCRRANQERNRFCRAPFLTFFALVCLWGYWHCGHSWPIVPASGDSEDDCGGDGM